jgi:hypothetical protein
MILGYRELQFVAFGFAAFLLIILGYVLFMDVRDRRLRRELDRVRRMVEGGDKR